MLATTNMDTTDEKSLPQDITEKALLLANLYKQGESVFGEAWKFHGWLNHPSPIFGGKKPIELVDSRSVSRPFMTNLSESNGAYWRDGRKEKMQRA